MIYWKSNNYREHGAAAPRYCGSRRRAAEISMAFHGEMRAAAHGDDRSRPEERDFAGCWRLKNEI